MIKGGGGDDDKRIISTKSIHPTSWLWRVKSEGLQEKGQVEDNNKPGRVSFRGPYLNQDMVTSNWEKQLHVRVIVDIKEFRKPHCINYFNLNFSKNFVIIWKRYWPVPNKLKKSCQKWQWRFAIYYVDT